LPKIFNFESKLCKIKIPIKPKENKRKISQNIRNDPEID
jgi:hypothetical protein